MAAAALWLMTNSDAGDEVARATMRAIAAEYGWPSYQTLMGVVRPNRRNFQAPRSSHAKMASKSIEWRFPLNA